jgi:hypothetical protein
MRLKFWKSKASLASTPLPVSASYPLEKVEDRHEISEEEAIPLIVVEGFGGGAGNTLWGDFADHLNMGSLEGHKRKTHFVK